MKDPTTMTETEKQKYIFERDEDYGNEKRINWIDDCLLGDIQTFVDGVKSFIQNKENLPGNLPRGGGNLSIPIIITTGLELISGLYAGKTKYVKDNHYNATENVKKFISCFFPDNYKRFPLLLWDGIRNGVVHTFSPKAFRFSSDDVVHYICFQFFVEDMEAKAFATKQIIKNTEGKDEILIEIKINSIELYKVLGEAIKEYRVRLENDEGLKDKFILAWSSIENHLREIDCDNDKKKEAEELLSKLNRSTTYPLLK